MEAIDMNTLISPDTANIINLDMVILAPLTFGEHTATIKSYSLEVAKNNNQFLSIQFQVDDEPTTRTRAIYSNDIPFMCGGIAKQFELGNIKLRDILQLAQTKPFKFWYVEQPNPTAPEKPYRNWVFFPPASTTTSAPVTIVNTDDVH